jgi:NitT/TauT family transport system ATP-binding protein
MSKYLELKSVSKKYQQQNKEELVLKNVNFSVKKGELAAILGPSGCGKSTLLKLIAGFIKTDQGIISKEGRIIKRPGLDRIMLFQDFEQLFPWLTVLNNIIFALKASRKTEKNLFNFWPGQSGQDLSLLAKDYLAEVKLSQYQDYYPHQLSGGMKQRVALARTLAVRGEIMLMDEPFASVDSQTRQELQQLLSDLQLNSSRTIIFVTHDIREAVFLADKIIILKDNPGEVISVLTNNLPHPRDRNSEQFNQLSKKISAFF